MFKSTKEDTPWIMINLVDVFEICFLQIYSGDKRIAQLTVSVGNDVDNNKNSVCIRNIYISSESNKLFSCVKGSLVGRIVYLTMYNKTPLQLRLREVIVWASP